MTPRTLRRKLQKKMKHKPYRKCPDCGDRATCRIVDDCGPGHEGPYRLFKTCEGCGRKDELFWHGGGKADTYLTP